MPEEKKIPQEVQKYIDEKYNGISGEQVRKEAAVDMYWKMQEKIEELKDHISSMDRVCEGLLKKISNLEKENAALSAEVKEYRDNLSHLLAVIQDWCLQKNIDPAK